MSIEQNLLLDSYIQVNISWRSLVKSLFINSTVNKAVSE